MTTDTQSQNSKLIAQAALQAFDCVSTSVIVQHGGFERNPIAKVLGSSRSPVLCVINSALIDIGEHKLHNGTVINFSLGLEAGAVLNNYKIIVNWR